MNTNKSTDRKKAKRISLFFHAGLLLLALYPFQKIILKDVNNTADTIEIVFSNGDITSGASSTAPETAVEPNKTPVSKQEMTKKAAPELPPSAPVLETPEAPIKIVQNEEAPKVETEAKTEHVPDHKTKEHKDVTSTPDHNSQEHENSSTDEGEGNQGDNITGKSLGEKDFGGDGIFGRKVIYRAPIANAAVENGVIAVNVCINRMGYITHAIIYNDKTTIKDKDLLHQALEIASDYRFEKDFTAPDIQCGRLTFIFKIK